MALSDALAAGPQAVKRSSKVDRWLQALPEPDQAEVRAAIADDEWPTLPLWRLLRDEAGLRCSPATFTRFREDAR